MRFLSMIRVVDGPFAETKEVIGGFAILESASMQAAIELTKRFLRIHGDAWEIECEVRQLDGPEFGREARQVASKRSDGVQHRSLVLAGEVGANRVVENGTVPFRQPLVPRCHRRAIRVRAPSWTTCSPRTNTSRT